MPERQHLLLAAGQVGGRLVDALRAAPGTARAPRPRARRALGAPACARASRPPAGSRATVSDGNTPWPPGTWVTPQRGDLVRRRVGDVAAVEDDRALVGLDHAADGLEQRRLAGAVRAEQRDDLALVDLEVDVEEHLHVAVVDLRARGTAAASPGPGGARRGPPSAAAAIVHTCLMSRSITRPAVEMTSPPTTKTGVMTSRPARMPIPSATAPTMGSTIESRDDPERAHREAHRPRPRAGWRATARRTRPVRRWPSVAAMAMLAITATHSCGARANTDGEARRRRRPRAR